MRQVKIGDQIEYSTWSIPGRKATVKVIEICKHGEKDGRSVDSCDLDSSPDIILTLSDGHWCYSDQVERVIKSE